MTENGSNRIETVVNAFNMTASPDASTHEIQEPLRKLINKILVSQDATKEEIIDLAAGPIYRRVERRWGGEEVSVYIRTGDEEGIDDRIRTGCRVFYEEVYEGILNEDKIELANQRNDILDAFYFRVRHGDQ